MCGLPNAATNCRDRQLEPRREGGAAAHDLGGDAVVNVQDSARLSGATVTPVGVAVEETSSISGIVIRFRRLDCVE